MKFQKYIWPCIFSAILVIFTGYVLLDTFVLPKSMEPVANDTTNTITIPQIEKPDESTIKVSDNSYEDENVKILLSQYREYNTDIYVAKIELSDIAMLKSAFAKDTYGYNVRDNASLIAEQNDAILAVNGDFYGLKDGNYVLRNGVLFRDTATNSHEDLLIYNNGSFGTFIEGTATGAQLIEDGVYQLLCFGPTLVRDNSICVSPDDTTGIAVKNPRTAIGINDEGHIFFLVADGRTEQSSGLTFFELAEFMKSIGITKLSYNLDGGGSSSMYFNGRIVNKPTTNGTEINERSVSDIVYIGYK